MKESMSYNPGYSQLRDFQVRTILRIVETNQDCKEGGVVFFGDSITEQCDIDTYYPTFPIKYNCGISGATSQQLLTVVDEGVIKYNPKVVVLLVGANDLGIRLKDSPRNIALNVKMIIDIIRGNLPETKILLVSTLPCVEHLKGYQIEGGIRNNVLLEMIFMMYQELIRDKKTSFLNVYEEFVDENKEGVLEYYVDGLHLSDTGYQLLSSKIIPVVEELLED